MSVFAAPTTPGPPSGSQAEARRSTNPPSPALMAPLRLEECSSPAQLLQLLRAHRHSPSTRTSKPSSCAADTVLSTLRTNCTTSSAAQAATWDSPRMLQARRAVAAYLSCVLEGSVPHCAADAPGSSLRSFLVYLLLAEADIVNAVRQGEQCSSSHNGGAPCPVPQNPAVEVAGASEGECEAGDSPERVAVAFLVRCTAYVVSQQATGTASGCEADRGAPSPAISAAPREPTTTTALALLRVSSCSAPGRTVQQSRGCPIPFWCSTGCDGLDAALGGRGFRSGWVTEIYGEAGAGKTQLALQCLLQQSATDLCWAAAALALHHNAKFQALGRHSRSEVGGLASSSASSTAAAVGESATYVQRCREVFDPAAIERVRCAVVYLVSEDVPTSRLGPLAAAAVRRSLRALQLHPLLAQLPSDVVDAVMRGVRQSCSVTMVLSRLQIRHVASISEVLRLFSSSPAGTVGSAVRLLAGPLARAVVVLDSVAAAVVAGQSDVAGAAQTDASVAAAATLLRTAAAEHNWCILVTNQVRAVPGSVRQAARAAVSYTKRSRSPPASSGAATQAVVPALGLSWAPAAHCRVLLRKSLSLGVRQLVLRHAPAEPPSQASYVVTQNGIEDA